MGTERRNSGTTRPLVSIIMPAWRAFQTIDRAIKSVSEQNIKEPFELIVVDDGSDDKDRTWQKIKSWERTFAGHPFISMKSFQTPVNQGPGTARRRAIEKSSGQYICYLDTDDEFYPSRILGAVRTFRQQRPPDIVLSKYVLVAEGKRSLFEPNKIISRIPDLLQKQNISIPLGVMHTREIYYKTTGWVKYLTCGEDGILWRRMCEAGAKFGTTQFVAGIYHIRKTGQSRTQRRFDNHMAFAFDNKHPKGSHGQYLDNLTDEELSQYFEK